MGVLAIWRYPVKAMIGELLDAVEIGPGGCAGDRRWIVVDTDTGERIANKRGPTDPRLRACRAEVLEDSDESLPLRVTLPDGETLEGGEIESALSELLERRVRLEAAGGAALGRFFATGAHHDAAPVHLITTGTLARLRALAPRSDWDARRFRPNLVLDDGGGGGGAAGGFGGGAAGGFGGSAAAGGFGGGAAAADGFATAPAAGGFDEDALLGGRLRASSGLELSVALPTPRCVVPTRALHADPLGGEELPADPGILRVAVQQHRIDLGPLGRQGCVGAYAEVERGGRVSVGERLEVEPPRVTPTEAIATAVTGLFGARR